MNRHIAPIHDAVLESRSQPMSRSIASVESFSIRYRRFSRRSDERDCGFYLTSDSARTQKGEEKKIGKKKEENTTALFCELRSR